jgi:hypothetical protein
MAPQEEAPQQFDPSRRLREDPSALEAPPLPQPPPPARLMKFSALPSAERLPTVEPRRVEVEEEGDPPSFDDLQSSLSVTEETLRSLERDS